MKERKAKKPAETPWLRQPEIPELPEHILPLDRLASIGRKAYRSGYKDGWKAGYQAGLSRLQAPGAAAGQGKANKGRRRPGVRGRTKP